MSTQAKAGVRAKAMEPTDQEEFCPWCGLTRRELYAQGQLGCARCYETFEAEVVPALREIHGEVEHLGKT